MGNIKDKEMILARAPVPKASIFFSALREIGLPEERQENST